MEAALFSLPNAVYSDKHWRDTDWLSRVSSLSSSYNNWLSEDKTKTDISVLIAVYVRTVWGHETFIQAALPCESVVCLGNCIHKCTKSKTTRSLSLCSDFYFEETGSKSLSSWKESLKEAWIIQPLNENSRRGNSVSIFILREHHLLSLCVIFESFSRFSISMQRSKSFGHVCFLCEKQQTLNQSDSQISVDNFQRQGSSSSCCFQQLLVIAWESDMRRWCESMKSEEIYLTNTSVAAQNLIWDFTDRVRKCEGRTDLFS